MGWEVTVQQNGTTTVKPTGGIRGVVFPAVDSNAVTDHLAIRINTIDSVPAERVQAQRRIRIMNTAEFARSPLAGMVRGLPPGTATEEWIYFGWQSLTNASSWRGGNHHIAVINSGVTSINNAAYQGQGLSHVIIPNTVISIGDNAFQNNRLAGLILPNSVRTIGDEAFRGNHLESINFSNGITSIGRSAFRDNRLISVNIPNRVTSIGNEAFRNNQLTSIVIPNSVTALAEVIFYDNPLQSVTIGPNVNTGRNLWSNQTGNWHNFQRAYNNNRYMGGTYTLENDSWKYQP